MTPFSQYKGWLGEGGIRNALIVSGPAVKRPKGSLNHGLMHVADLMPTLLEVAGASYPKTLAGRELPPLIGKSWGAVLAGQAESPRTAQDVSGLGAVRQPRGAPGRLEAALASTSRWARANGSCSTWRPTPAERKDLAAKRSPTR